MTLGHAVFVLIIIELSYLNVKCAMLEKGRQQGILLSNHLYLENILIKS
jgi:hypothetical protein